MIEAVLVMMNNYFHDLAVAFLFASTLMAHLMVRNWPERVPVGLATTLQRVAWGSLAWVMLGGIVRMIFYQEYEWVPKAGTAQIPALIAKHIMMFGLTAYGIVGVLRLKVRLSESSD